MKDTREFEELYARLEDMKKRAVRGEVGISAFLSPRELHYAAARLRACGAAFFEYGGYGEAERKRIYLLPEYMEQSCDADSLREYGESDGIAVISAKGSGFCRISHRDFMGSLLGLGIERSVIGDIVALDDASAMVFCDEKIADFLISAWDQAGRDKIKCQRAELSEGFAPKRNYTQINDTVASPRLDCVVAALCNLSREKARECVLAGACELNYECEERPDREVPEGALISVRGQGKFKIFSIGTRTKKGRLRLSAGKLT